MAKRIELETNNENRVEVEYNGAEFIFFAWHQDDSVEVCMDFRINAEELKSVFRSLEKQE